MSERFTSLIESGTSLTGGATWIERLRMSKTNVTRLFVGAIVALGVGLVLGIAALWAALASDAVDLGGRHVVDVNGGSGAC